MTENDQQTNISKFLELATRQEKLKDEAETLRGELDAVMAILGVGTTFQAPNLTRDLPNDYR
jgi:hypothetical protein